MGSMVLKGASCKVWVRSEQVILGGPDVGTSEPPAPSRGVSYLDQKCEPFCTDTRLSPGYNTIATRIWRDD